MCTGLGFFNCSQNVFFALIVVTAHGPASVAWIKVTLMFHKLFANSKQIVIFSSDFKVEGEKPPWPPPSPCKQSGKGGAGFDTRARQRTVLLEHFTQQLSGKMRMIAIVKMRHSAGLCLSAAASQQKD